MHSEDILKAAHKHSIRNKAEILSSTVCGCFYCLEIFPPIHIKEWLKEKDIENTENYTALCPCGIDAVIGSESGYPINKIFLTDMHNLYFSIED